MHDRSKVSRFYGVAGICLLYGALAIGVVATARHSWTYAAVGIAISALWVVPVAWFYCAKCCCRLDCGHVLLGLITRILPRRKAGAYTLVDGLFTLLPILAAVGYPQFWLAKEIPLLIAFWGLVAVAGAGVPFFVCSECTNAACPFNRAEASAEAGAPSASH